MKLIDSFLENYDKVLAQLKGDVMQSSSEELRTCAAQITLELMKLDVNVQLQMVAFRMQGYRAPGEDDGIVVAGSPLPPQMRR